MITAGRFCWTIQLAQVNGECKKFSSLSFFSLILTHDYGGSWRRQSFIEVHFACGVVSKGFIVLCRPVLALFFKQSRRLSKKKGTVGRTESMLEFSYPTRGIASSFFI